MIIDKMKAIDLAKYIITKKALDDNSVTNLRLQFLLFYLQAEFIKETGKTLFDDVIEAWKFGPCVPTVYYEYSYLGAFLLGHEYDDYDKIKNLLDEKTFSFINHILDMNKDRHELNPYVFSQKSAWSKTFDNGNGFEEEITPEMILKCHG